MCTESEYPTLRKGAVIEIRVGNESHMGFLDHVDSQRVYVGRTEEFVVTPKEKLRTITDIKTYDYVEIRYIFLYFQPEPDAVEQK